MMALVLLTFADFQKPFLLRTDAPWYKLGAEDRKYHPVTCVSQGLKGSESKYHSPKLEFLTFKFAITEQFKEYLQYQAF